MTEVFICLLVAACILPFFIITRRRGKEIRCLKQEWDWIGQQVIDLHRACFELTHRLTRVEKRLDDGLRELNKNMYDSVSKVRGLEAKVSALEVIKQLKARDLELVNIKLTAELKDETTK